MFNTKTSSKDEVIAFMKAGRFKMENACKVSLTEDEINADNKRIKCSVEFILGNNNEEGFDFYVHDKPQTVGCEQAMEYRLDPLKINREENVFGSKEVSREVKSLIMEDKSGTIHYFIMQGDEELPKEIFEKAGLKKADLTVVGIVAYTANPATVISLCNKADKEVVVHEKSFTPSAFLCNNGGSRFASVVMSPKHYESSMNNLKNLFQNGISYNTFDGTMESFISNTQRESETKVNYFSPGASAANESTTPLGQSNSEEAKNITPRTSIALTKKFSVFSIVPNVPERATN